MAGFISLNCTSLWIRKNGICEWREFHSFANAHTMHESDFLRTVLMEQEVYIHFPSPMTNQNNWAARLLLISPCIIQLLIVHWVDTSPAGISIEWIFNCSFMINSLFRINMRTLNHFHRIRCSCHNMFNDLILSNCFHEFRFYSAYFVLITAKKNL